MGQAKAEETSTAEKELTVMTVWPTLAATGYGRWWGQRYENSWGFTLLGVPVTVGRITALLSIPFVLPLYFHMLVPRLPFVVFGFPNSACRRYRLTNQRVLIEQAFGGGEQQSVSLARFDSIEVEVLPGQAWYPAGDLVFPQWSDRNPPPGRRATSRTLQADLHEDASWVPGRPASSE